MCSNADRELDLVTYCKNEKVPFKTFENFLEILDVVKDIVAGKISVENVAAGGGLETSSTDLAVFQ